MAATLAKPAWEEKLLEKGLLCPICIEFLNEPLKLGCGHAFCRLCVLQSTRLAPDGRCCPECRAVIEIRDPLTHPADEELKLKIAESVPADEFASREIADSDKTKAFLSREQKNLPVFYMRGVASRPGDQVSLHLFEPRYKVLIRRAWEGNQQFLCTQAQPRDGDHGLLVQVDSARFLPDGRANIVGHGIEHVKLDRVWIEQSLGGLFYAEVAPSATNDAIVARRPSTSTTPSASSRRPSATGGMTEAQTKGAIRAAIAAGAPAYHRQQITLCAEIYLSVAANAVRELSTDSAMSVRLQRGVTEAEEASRRGNVDAAAWALRNAFDESLAMPLPTARPSRRDALDAVGDVVGASVVEQELPVFYIDQGSRLGSNELLRLRFFEERYRILARNVSTSTTRLFLYAESGMPAVDSTVTLAKLERCTWDGSGSAHVCIVGIGSTRICGVRQDARQGDLLYATCVVPVDIVEKDESTCKCCVMQ